MGPRLDNVVRSDGENMASYLEGWWLIACGCCEPTREHKQDRFGTLSLSLEHRVGVCQFLLRNQHSISRDHELVQRDKRRLLELKRLHWRSSDEELLLEELPSQMDQMSEELDDDELMTELDSSSTPNHHLVAALERQIGYFSSKRQLGDGPSSCQGGEKLTRNKLAKLINLKSKSTKFKSFKDTHPLEACLYELESIAFETNELLGRTLRSLSEDKISFALRLTNTIERLGPLSDDPSLERKKLLGEASRRGRGAHKELLTSNDSGLFGGWTSGESGPFEQDGELGRQVSGEIEAKGLVRRRKRWRFLTKRGTISKYFETRSSRPVLAIIQFTWRLFAEMLNTSDLFCSTKDDPFGAAGALGAREALNLQQFKIFACVECEKLRARLRHEWLPKCFHLIFEQMEDHIWRRGGHSRRPVEARGIRARARQWSETRMGLFGDYWGNNADSLPSLEAREKEYFAHLDVLLAQLIRRHFLAAAFELWLQRVKRSIGGSSSGEPLLELSVELIEHQHEGAPVYAACRSAGLGNDEPGENELGADSPLRNGLGSAKICIMQPSESVKETLGFVCDELERICSRLPRLQSIADCALVAHQDPSSVQPQNAKSGSNCFLFNAANSRDLLAQAKGEIGRLIERKPAQPMDSLAARLRTLVSGEPASSKRHDGPSRGPVVCPPGSRDAAFRPPVEVSHSKEQDGWMANTGYLFVIETVNRFRSGQADEEELHDVSGWPGPGTVSGEAGHEPAGGSLAHGLEAGGERDARLTELGRTSKHIELLDEVARRLSLELGRFFQCGQLAKLDCGPLSESLAKVVARERSLLVRLKLDELDKLMEKLRLQFDELELNIDLEIAVEDYLNERWQAKQSQQSGELEQELLFDSHVAESPLGLADNLPPPEGDQQQVAEGSSLVDEEQKRELDVQKRDKEEMEENQASKMNAEGARMLDEEQEEELVNALSNNNNLNVAHLFALSQSQSKMDRQRVKRPAGELEDRIGERIAPLIECKLLAKCYRYLGEFLINELDKLQKDMRFLFLGGLRFLSELVPNKMDKFEETNDRYQLETIDDLARRANEFRWLLDESCQRLNVCRHKLLRSNGFRSRVLSEIVLEFDCLMLHLSAKRLQQLKSSNLKQLDIIQELATWAQKLGSRLEFLRCQNELIAKEFRLLTDEVESVASGAHLEAHADNSGDDRSKVMDWLISSDRQHAEGVEKLKQSQAAECRIRVQILDQWHEAATFMVQFWQLTYSFETQLVKWLNSDARRINIDNLVLEYRERFVAKCDQLARELEQRIVSAGGRQASCNGLEGGIWATFEQNVAELKSRLNQFEETQLPVFKFLTNKHLTDEHWQELSSIWFLAPNGSASNGLETRQQREESLMLARKQLRPDNYTTANQLIELKQELETYSGQHLQGDHFVAYLQRLTHRASIEHQLSGLLLAEASRRPNGARRRLASAFRLANFSQQELAGAANKFIEAKLSGSKAALLIGSGELRKQWANRLVSCFLNVCRLTALVSSLDLQLGCQIRVGASKRGTKKQAPGFLLVKSGPKLLDRHQPLRDEEQSAMFIEFLRLFCECLTVDCDQLQNCIDRLKGELDTVRVHSEEIGQLLDNLRGLKAHDLKQVTSSNEKQLSQLERDNLKLELDREILATRESLVLAKQRDALNKRDNCIRQIVDRAIPALRAASRALDCLGDGRPLKWLRSLRPRPPLALRLVIEPVCLLRNAATNAGRPESESASGLSWTQRRLETAPNGPSSGTSLSQIALPNTMQASSNFSVSPVRHFDPVSGLMTEDYWPVAWRTLNGLHSSRLLNDLRNYVNGRMIDRKIMITIRRKYLSRKEFSVESIGKISRDCAALARWLLAVDVYNRVLEVVKPSYLDYLKSEEDLRDSLEELLVKRQQIDQLGGHLERTDAAIKEQIRNRNDLVDLLTDCSQHLQRVSGIQIELKQKEEHLIRQLAIHQRRQSNLIRNSAIKAANCILIVPSTESDKSHPATPSSLEKLISRELSRVE